MPLALALAFPPPPPLQLLLPEPALAAGEEDLDEIVALCVDLKRGRERKYGISLDRELVC